jgi:hypothetical protein
MDAPIHLTDHVIQSDVFEDGHIFIPIQVCLVVFVNIFDKIRYLSGHIRLFIEFIEDFRDSQMIMINGFIGLLLAIAVLVAAECNQILRRIILMDPDFERRIDVELVVSSDLNIVLSTMMRATNRGSHHQFARTKEGRKVLVRPSKFALSGTRVHIGLRLSQKTGKELVSSNTQSMGHACADSCLRAMMNSSSRRIQMGILEIDGLFR